MNGGLPFAYGVNEFTTMPPWSFEEDVENYAALGVEALESCEAKLDEGRMEEQLSLVGEAGLPISSVQPAAVRTIFPSSMMPKPEDPQNGWTASAEPSSGSRPTRPGRSS